MCWVKIVKKGPACQTFLPACSSQCLSCKYDSSPAANSLITNKERYSSPGYTLHYCHAMHCLKLTVQLLVLYTGINIKIHTYTLHCLTIGALLWSTLLHCFDALLTWIWPLAFFWANNINLQNLMQRTTRPTYFWLQIFEYLMFRFTHLNSFGKINSR